MAMTTRTSMSVKPLLRGVSKRVFMISRHYARFRLLEKAETALLGEKSEAGAPEMKKAGPVKDQPVERVAPDFAYLAEVTRAAKDSGFREAPPTRAPSMSGWAMSSSTFSGFTEPPYWMRTLAAASAPKTSEITLRIKEWASWASLEVAVRPVPMAQTGS